MKRVGLIVQDLATDFIQELTEGVQHYCSLHDMQLFVFIVRAKNWWNGVFDYQHYACMSLATDKNLGSYLSKKLDVKMHVWKDYCRVHNTFSEEHIKELINEHPNADIAAHPECPEHILNYAKYIGSTTGIINYINKSERKEFIILTEPGIKYQLEKNSTDKQYFFVKNECGQNNICINRIIIS